MGSTDVSSAVQLGRKGSEARAERDLAILSDALARSYVSEAEITALIVQSLEECEPRPEPDQVQRPEIIEKRGEAQPPAYGDALTLLSSSSQYDWVVKKLFERKRKILTVEPYLLMDGQSARLLFNRVNQFEGHAPPFLEVQVSLELLQVDVPDTTKDEIQLDAYVVTGADPRCVLDYMARTRMIGESQIEETLSRWQAAPQAIGRTPEEYANLENCLLPSRVGWLLFVLSTFAFLLVSAVYARKSFTARLRPKPHEDASAKGGPPQPATG